MPLIPCAECRRQISDQAVACPHCGFPLRNLTRSVPQPPLPPPLPPPPVAIPASLVSERPASVVCPPNRHSNVQAASPLQRIAYRQKLLLYAILIALLCQYPIWYGSQVIWLVPLGLLLYLAYTAFGLWSFFKLGDALSLPLVFTGFLAIGLFFPCVALGSMYVLVYRANSALQLAGVQVGLMGAHLPSVPECSAMPNR